MDALTFGSTADAGARLRSSLAGGWRLWRRSLWGLGLIALSPLLVEAMVQPIPVVGMLASKVLAFGLLGVITVTLDQVARTGRIDVATLRAVLRERAPAWIGVTLFMLLAVFGSQVLFGRILCGPHAIEWLLLGDMKTHPPQSPLKLLAVIPFGVIPGTLLMLATPWALLGGKPAFAAIAASVRAVGRHAGFFVAYALVSTALLLAGMFTLVGMLVVVPWLSASGYVVYRLLADTPDGMRA